MHSNSDSERFYAEMSAMISALPGQSRNDAVFALFGIGLKMMDTETIREVREELVWRFPQRDDARDIGTTLIEILDGHLALRAVRQELDEAQ